MSEGMNVTGATYELWDQQLVDGSRRFDAAFFESYLGALGEHPLKETATAWKVRSMLAVETLLLMRAYAIEAKAQILEIGAYMGGGTVALACGARYAGGKSILTLELGGAQDHPTMPSQDIVADWHKTLEMFGYVGDVDIIVGWADAPETVTRAIKHFDGKLVDLVVIDANGMIWEFLQKYQSILSDDCLFIIDDYCNILDDTQNVKFAMTRESIDQGERAGAFIRHGLALWGTWYGRRGPGFASFVDEGRRDERRRLGLTPE